MDRGVSSVQFLLAAGLGLILFLAFANVVVVQYGRGAVRSALDQGVRVAAMTGSEFECQQRVDDVLDELLGGVMGGGVTARCELTGNLAVARAQAVFASWTPLAPEFRMEMVAFATAEPKP